MHSKVNLSVLIFLLLGISQVMFGQSKYTFKEVDTRVTNKLDVALNWLAAEQIDEHKRVFKLEEEGLNQIQILNKQLSLRGNEVLVEVYADHAKDADPLLKSLLRFDFKLEARHDRILVGWLPVPALPKVDGLTKLTKVQSVGQVITSVGAVENFAEVAMQSDIVRDETRLVDGSDVAVGIISSSWDLGPQLNAPGAAAGVASGDLPNNVIVLDDAELNPDGTLPFPLENLDEGRGMAEVVHDIAPGANLLFHEAGGSPVMFAQAIDDLVAEGADIVVDDVVYYNEPWFSDGIIAQKIDEVATNNNVAVISSAGNDGNRDFFIGDFQTTPAFGFTAFDFDPGAAEDPFLAVALNGGSVNLQFQWDEPFQSACNGCPGAQNEFLLVVFNADTGNQITALNTVNTAGEALLTQGIVGTANIVIAILQLDSNPLPTRVRFRLTTEDGAEIAGPTFDLDAPTISGNHNAASGIVVGGAHWFATPEGAPLLNLPSPASPVLSSEFSSAGSIFNNFNISSLGGLEILFDANGNRLPTPLIRQNPSIVAPDGSNTTFFGGFDGLGGLDNWFFGTSCSSPNAAGVAALLQQAAQNTLTPQEIKDLLTSTAVDMDDPYDNGQQTDPNDPLFTTGFDFGSGFGLINADAAIEQLVIDLGIDAISMVADCKDGNEARFVITNPNGFGVEIELDASKNFRLEGETTYHNTLVFIVPPGETAFYVPLIAGRIAYATLEWDPAIGFGGGYVFVKKSGGWPSCGSNLTDNTNLVENLSEMGAEISNFSMTVFPNPAPNGQFNLSYQTDQTEQVMINLYNQQGQMVFQTQEYMDRGKNELPMQLSQLPKGIYNLQLQGLKSSNSITKRLLIE